MPAAAAYPTKSFDIECGAHSAVITFWYDDPATGKEYILTSQKVVYP